MTSNSHATPLERIRQAERTCSQQVRAAQVEAEESKQRTRKQTSRLKQEAMAIGRQQGESDYNTAIDAAHQEAREMVEQAHERVKHLVHDSEIYIAVMVEQALEIIQGGGDR